MAANTWKIVVVASGQLERGTYQRLFDRDKATQYILVFAEVANDAVEHVRNNMTDALVMSVEKPNPEAESALRQLSSVRPDMPVIVFYGGEDSTYRKDCLNSGAADAIQTKNLNALTLRLAVASAIGKVRMREARVSERKAMAYELVSEAVVNGWLQATKGWNPLLRNAKPKKFAEIVEAYEQVLIEWVRNKRAKKRQSRAPLRHIGNMIEQAGAGAGDVVDIHSHAVGNMVKGMDETKARSAAWSTHGLALDVIGRLQSSKTGHRGAARTVNSPPS